MPVPTLSALVVPVAGLTITGTLSASGCTVADLDGLEIVAGEDTDARVTGAAIVGTTITFTLSKAVLSSQALHLGVVLGAIRAADSSPIAAVTLSATNNSTVVFGTPSAFRAYAGNGSVTFRWRGSGRTDVEFLVYSLADNYVASVGATHNANHLTITGLTNGTIYTYKLASRPYAQLGGSPTSTKTTAVEIIPIATNDQEDLWTAIASMSDGNYDLSQRFPDGIFADRSEIGEAMPALLATELGGETEESTEDALGEYLIQFDIWAQTDTEILQAIREVKACYQNQPCGIVTNDVTVPLPGHSTTMLEGRPHKMKEEDETYGAIWRGIVTLRFFIVENSVGSE